MVDAPQDGVGSPVSDAGPPVTPAPLGRSLLLIALAFGSSLAICGWLNQDEPSLETGTISARSTKLRSAWTGRIERLLIEPGESVQAGQPIAVLINEPLRQTIARQEREVTELHKALELATSQADAEITRRLREIDRKIVELRLRSQDFTAQATDETFTARLQRLEQRRTDLPHRLKETAGVGRIRQELVRAEATLSGWQSQPVEMLIPSPVTGTVLRLLRGPGDRLVCGTALAELSDRRQPLVIVELPEPLAKRFALGDKIPLQFPGQGTGMGRVADLQWLDAELNADGLTQSPPSVRVEIEPIDGAWPSMPPQAPVQLRTSDSNATSRRIH